MYKYTFICVYIYTNSFIHIHIYVYIHIYKYICIYTYIHIYMHIYIYTCIHVNKSCCTCEEVLSHTGVCHIWCNTLHLTLQHTASHTATHCITHCNTLHHTLQRTATYCITPCMCVISHTCTQHRSMVTRNLQICTHGHAKRKFVISHTRTRNVIQSEIRYHVEVIFYTIIIISPTDSNSFQRLQHVVVIVGLFCRISSLL